jgi:transcriptional regulator with XRE-family HTH domain
MNNIRRLRTLAGKRLADVARKADMHPQTLCNLESGRAHLYAGYRQRIADALGVDPASL